MQFLSREFSRISANGVAFLSTRSASAYVMVDLRHWGQLRGSCWEIVQVLAWIPLKFANAPSKFLAHVRPPSRIIST